MNANEHDSNSTAVIYQSSCSLTWPQNEGKRQKVKKYWHPWNRLWRLIWVWNVKDSAFSRQSIHRWRWGWQTCELAAIYQMTKLYPPGRFLVIISVRGWVYPRATVPLEELGKLGTHTHRYLRLHHSETCEECEEMRKHFVESTRSMDVNAMNFLLQSPCFTLYL
jgi:hypothetical protein